MQLKIRFARYRPRTNFVIKIWYRGSLCYKLTMEILSKSLKETEESAKVFMEKLSVEIRQARSIYKNAIGFTREAISLKKAGMLESTASFEKLGMLERATRLIDTVEQSVSSLSEDGTISRMRTQLGYTPKLAYITQVLNELKTGKGNLSLDEAYLELRRLFELTMF